MFFLSLLLFVIFLVLGLIHINWALGGKWFSEKAIPTNKSGERLFSPGKTASAVVGLGLIAFGTYYLFLSEFVSLYIPVWISDILRWIIPAIFFVRAVGEFKYVGFFKKVRSTTFGKLDSTIYSPLCLFIGLSGVLVNLGFTTNVTELDLKSQFSKYGVNGCFVLFDQAENEYFVYNKALCDSGYIPASTFKIPHSLIVIEEKLIQDTNQIIPWDGTEWRVASWNQNQTIETALKNSCVWAYVGFAEQLGIEKYDKYVHSFDYGNKDIGGPPSRFWLSGKLRISAMQQVDFLRKMYAYELGVSERSTDIVKSILILEKKDDYTLSGKTGAGLLSDSEYIMWLVGYVERNSNPYFYALNFVTDNYEETARTRYDLVKDILKDLALMDD